MGKASKIVRLVLGGSFVLAIGPALENFFVELARDYGVYDHPRQRVEEAMSLASSVVADPRYWPTVTFLGGLLLGSLLDLGARAFDRRRPPKPIYIDTRLRLRLDPSGSGQHILESQTNIKHWQQIIYRTHVPLVPPITDRADSISIFFDRPTAYARPVIDTFGVPIESYRFHPQGEDGHVITIDGLEKIGLIEIWFPPVEFYERKNTDRVAEPLSAS